MKPFSPWPKCFFSLDTNKNVLVNPGQSCSKVLQNREFCLNIQKKCKEVKKKVQRSENTWKKMKEGAVK